MTRVPYLCSVDTCERRENFKKSGLCRPHYLRKIRGSKNWDGPLIRQDNMSGNCVHPGCDYPVKTTGYCNAHYIRYQTGKDMDKPIPDFHGRTTECPVEECGRPVRARGMCATHYQRVKMGHPLYGPINSPNPDRGCKVPGCLRKHEGKGYCGTHGYTQRRYNLTDEKVLELHTTNCEICGNPETQKRTMSVDHDHSCCPGEGSCGRCVRGFLCSNCNRGLGLFEDDFRILEQAARYLKTRSIGMLE